MPTAPALGKPVRLARATIAAANLVCAKRRDRRSGKIAQELRLHDTHRILALCLPDPLRCEDSFEHGTPLQMPGNGITYRLMKPGFRRMTFIKCMPGIFVSTKERAHAMRLDELSCMQLDATACCAPLPAIDNIHIEPRKFYFARPPSLIINYYSVRFHLQW
ncbi:hypothetical protein [Saliniramus fredricksonii]|uniref:hypothetical protein n=1 Tax=Saliniramus fredricksonii TaxID=1653334 RepID=UPI001042076F|nr:hypothetical protein [Saliniramus fredricksonii]